MFKKFIKLSTKYIYLESLFYKVLCDFVSKSVLSVYDLFFKVAKFDCFLWEFFWERDGYPLNCDVICVNNIMLYFVYWLNELILWIGSTICIDGNKEMPELMLLSGMGTGSWGPLTLNMRDVTKVKVKSGPRPGAFTNVFNFYFLFKSNIENF